MKLNFHSRLKRTVGFILAGTLLTILSLLGQSGQRLYLVTGLAANNAFPVSVPSTLVAIDEGASAPIKLLDLGGTSSVLADHDRKLVLIGNFLQGFVVLDMRSPTNPRTIKSAPDLLCTPPNAKTDMGCVDAFGLEQRLLGIELTGSDAGEQRDLPADYFRFLRTQGYWSPIDLQNNHIFLFYKNGKLLFHSNSQLSDFGIPLPANAEAFVNARDIVLAVSNDDMVVIDCYRAPGPEGTESHTLQIYDRKLRTWHSADLGAGPSIRGFGPWIATASFVRKRPIGRTPETDLRLELESPGAESRKKVVLNPKVREREQMSLDTLFQQVPFQFTGNLGLYNIRSKRSYVIRTGQGDSEVLLVEGDTVYYRVNDALYKASIGQRPELESTKILSDPSVQLAHWAFLGP